MKFIIPASLIGTNGITGEEKNWVQIADLLKLNHVNQSAHRVVKAQAPEIHDAICKKDCKLNGGKSVIPKAEKQVKAKSAKGTVTCVCGVSVPIEFASTVSLASALTGGKTAKPLIYCLNCAVSKLM